MNNIVDDYLREVETHLQVGPSQKQRIMDELRGHLLEKVDDLRNQQPDLSSDDAQRAAVRDFGNPRELALSFDLEGAPIIENKAGLTVARVGRAVGRGTGRFFKFLGVFILVVLVLALGLGIWAFYEVRPYVEGLVEDNIGTTVYSYHEHCQPTACDGAAFVETFYLPPDAKDLRVSTWVGVDRDDGPANGTVRVTFVSPDGAERYNRSLSVSGERSFYQTIQWPPLEGTWTVIIDYDGFAGILEMDVQARGLTPA